MVHNFIQVIKYRNYILIRENFASDFPEMLSRSLFYMKGVNKTDGDLRITLLNKKWGQDLTANVIYISGCD